MENPYWLALVAPQPAYLARIGAFTAGFGALFLAVERAVSSCGTSGSLHEVSSPRNSSPGSKPGRSGVTAASNVCAIVHSSVTSSVAVWVTLRLALGGQSEAAVWAWHWALAFSQGYFIADAALYGTRRETWVIIHHLWMAVAHHPIGEPLRLCALMGCGDCTRAVWLSATGYWAEISTVSLNVRWFHHRLLRKSSAWYTANSAILLITYPAARMLAVPFILGSSLWPFWDEYRRQGLGSLVTFTTVTYLAMSLMSSYYYYTLIRRGLGRVLAYTPDSDKES